MVARVVGRVAVAAGVRGHRDVAVPADEFAGDELGGVAAGCEVGGGREGEGGEGEGDEGGGGEHGGAGRCGERVWGRLGWVWSSEEKRRGWVVGGRVEGGLIQGGTSGDLREKLPATVASVARSTREEAGLTRPSSLSPLPSSVHHSPAGPAASPSS